MRRLIQSPTLRRFLAARDGATAIEYAIIAAGVAGAIIATVTTLGGSVSAMWTVVAGIFS